MIITTESIPEVVKKGPGDIIESRSERREIK